VVHQDYPGADSNLNMTLKSNIDSVVHPRPESDKQS